ncbi:1-phosphofructokinase [Rhodospirillaceae bacterium SYSU D60014]|uniref:1-phosphofructokinase family hexose kinase n=1 Tax=Virgifigura deserti TaxID=2268457 RepID=UPI000E66A257
MTPIVTLTMNPALDLTTAVEVLVHEKKLRCEVPRLDPGGGGINVARVIKRLGGEALALYTAGGVAGQTLGDLLEKEGVAGRGLPITGQTRQNVMVHEASTQHRFRFVMPGPTLDEAAWRHCLHLLDDEAGDATYVVASGSLPPGVPMDFYAQLARQAKRRGFRLVVDSSGPALRQALAEGVYLVKPNKDEIRELAGRDLQWPGDHEAFAADLIGQGASEIVVVSHGAEGALIVSKADRCHVPAPDVTVVSAVGAGDSFVGGLALALAWGWPLPETCRFAAAAAAATLLTPGTELCRREDVERLYAALSAGHA